MSSTSPATNAAICPARNLRAAAVLALSTLLMAPAVAPAQPAPDAAPYRGLFGTSGVARVPADGTPRPAGGDAFAFSASLSSLLESKSAPSGGPEAFDSSGADDSHTALALVLSKVFSGRRVKYDVRAQSDVRMYHDDRGAAADRQSLSAKMETRLTRRTTVSLSGRGAYAPTYTLNVPLTGDASDATPSPLGVELHALRSANAGAGVVVTRRAGRLTVIDVGYDVNGVSFLDRNQAELTQRWHARAGRTFRNGMALQARYDLGLAASRLTDRTRQVMTNEVDVAFRYIPAALHDTRFSASVRPAFVRRRHGGMPGAEAGMRLGGSVAMDHRLSRAWMVGLGYQRALYSNEGFVQPAFVQTTSGRIEARLTRLTLLQVTGAHSAGMPDPEAPLRPMPDSVACRVRWSLATSASSVVFAEYQRTAYRESPGGASVSAGARLDRHGLRVGVTVGLQGH